jgi:hypothetical protein
MREATTPSTESDFSQEMFAKVPRFLSHEQDRTIGGYPNICEEATMIEEESSARNSVRGPQRGAPQSGHEIIYWVAIRKWVPTYPTRSLFVSGKSKK